MKVENRTVIIFMRPSADEAAGWQLIDLATGALIEEGPWMPAPGEARIDLPPEDGTYRILLSTVSAGKGWAYDRGEPLRVVDIESKSGNLSVRNDRVTRFSRLRLEGLPGRVLRFLAEPWKSLWKNRLLIATLVHRDFEARYRGSLGDRVWAIAHPLLLMLTYWFVFGVVLRTRFGADPDPSVYVLFFLCGMLPWLAFSEAVGRAPNIILENRNLVKKLVFPVEILPVNLVFSGLVTSGLALIVYLFFLMATRERIPPEALWLPVLLIPQLMLTAGICWAWSAIGVVARDLGQINGFLLTLLFFLTPICYPTEQLPAQAAAVLQKSPLFKLVAEYRLLFISMQPPEWRVLAQLFLMAAAAFYFGYGVFRKMRRLFADAL